MYPVPPKSRKAPLPGLGLAYPSVRPLHDGYYGDDHPSFFSITTGLTAVALTAGTGLLF
jgi:hypothetical protein